MIEFLGEIETEFKNSLACLSGVQMNNVFFIEVTKVTFLLFIFSLALKNTFQMEQEPASPHKSQTYIVASLSVLMR